MKQKSNADAEIGANRITDQSDDNAAYQHFPVPHRTDYRRNEGRGAEQADMCNGEEVAAYSSETAEKQVQQHGNQHDIQYEIEKGECRCTNIVDVELGSHHYAENQYEYHSQFKGFRQFPHLFRE